MGKFCDIKSKRELSNWLRIPYRKLTYMLYARTPESYYETFTIPKRNGDLRIIHATKGDLKELQVKLSNILWLYQKSLWEEKGINSNLSHAFEKEKSIITNAVTHRNKRYILNLDLKDFFESFHFGRVQGFFEKNKNFNIPHDVAVALAQLTCYKGRLPQGAPSSPIITNLICQTFDVYIWRLAKEYRLDYSRYADDLTFSTNNKYFINQWQDFLTNVSSLIRNFGFEINDKKTRLHFRSSRQEVTGLVVNKKLNVNSTYIRKTRAMAHNLYVSGEFFINEQLGTINQLEGRFAFINQLDRYNNKRDSSNIKHNNFNLNGRERQYQAFLFYKYFFANKKPVIITEGKTDVLYIKAALKNLCNQYPSLIQKDTNGGYTYKFSFFRRTKRLRYFFNISLDGADTMKNIYYYFIGRDRCPAYFKSFQKLRPSNKYQPVILLYDNELNCDRPLKKFLSQVKDISALEKEAFKSSLQMRLVPDSNLFVATNPLVDKKEECEIEDLFFEDVLNISLDGKTFCRKDTFDEKTYFGKDIFSKYVYENYSTIDFSRFVPMLNAIDLIVKRFAIR